MRLTHSTNPRLDSDPPSLCEQTRGAGVDPLPFAVLYFARLALDTIRGLVVVICTFSVSREYADVAYASGSHHEEAMKLSLSAQPTAALCAFYFILYYSSGMPAVYIIYACTVAIVITSTGQCVAMSV